MQIIQRNKKGIKTMIISIKIVTILALTAAAARGLCPSPTTCAECTSAPHNCYWSMELQACVSPHDRISNSVSMVARPLHCPRITVANRTVTPDADAFAYRVSVIDDRVGFLYHLYSTGARVTCEWGPDVRARGRPLPYDGVIECDPVRRSAFREVAPFVRRFRVAFGDRNQTLLFSYDSDYYTEFVASGCGGFGFTQEGCFDCLWTDQYRRYYVKACAVRFRCLGIDYTDSHYLNAVDAPAPLAVQNVTTRCPWAIAVESFEPDRVAYALKPLTLDVSVKNLAVLAERFAVLEVTVAGRRCLNVSVTEDADGRTTGRLTCRYADRYPDTNGPVRVVFGTKAAAGREASFAVESTEQFYEFGAGFIGKLYSRRDETINGSAKN